MPPVTIRQLAKLAGCSRTTVSLALRNNPRITPEMRGKILQLAKKMGYKRDPVMSTAMTRMRAAHHERPIEKLAYLTWWDAPQRETKSAHDKQGFAGACQRATEMGYEIEEFWAKAPRLTMERLSKILHARGISGIIIGTLPRPLGHVRLEWSKFATVTLGSTVANHGLHRVMSSHFQGMLLALRQLRHRGYKKIGFTSLTDQSERTNQGWLAGYLTYQNRQAQKLKIPPLIVSPWDTKKFSQWMEKYQPDAVVSNLEEPLTSLRQLGYRVPGEVGYACLDCIDATSSFAGIDQLRRQINIAAVELLVAQIESNQSGLCPHPKIVHIEGVWRDGPTVRAASRAA
jgi:DNA-binding LacI/PurR family transcriptional regulator